VEEQKPNWQAKKNRIDRVADKIEFEYKHGLRPGNQKIGSIYKYDHKITSSIAAIFSSLAIILQQSVFSYLYILGLIKVVKDSFSSGINTRKKFKIKAVKFKPLIYYIITASIIVVAALTSNHVIPGIEGGLTYYGAKILP